ncbi:MAG: pyridoxal 5'-phosphate synthase glutaminase subunit PdxT [Candidatus Diapherotrites archaeon]
MKTIGVLSFQGSFAEHLNCIKELNLTPQKIKSVKELQKCDALIIPGGETTTLRKLLVSSGLKKEIYSKAKQGFPVYGTCAGAILLAKKINEEKPVLPLIDVLIERNAYGSQLESFEKKIKINAKEFNNSEKLFNAVFIRAPQIKSILSNKVEVLAECEKKPVMLRQGNILVSMFHPELTNDLRIHEYFISLI